MQARSLRPSLSRLHWVQPKLIIRVGSFDLSWETELDFAESLCCSLYQCRAWYHHHYWSVNTWLLFMLAACYAVSPCFTLIGTCTAMPNLVDLVVVD